MVMIYKMIAGDIRRFASIWGLFILGFSLGFYYLFQNVGEENVIMLYYPDALYLTFQMSLGDFKDVVSSYKILQKLKDSLLQVFDKKITILNFKSKNSKKKVREFSNFRV